MMRNLMLFLVAAAVLPSTVWAECGGQTCGSCAAGGRVTYYSSVLCRNTAEGNIRVQASSTVSPGEACRLAREHCINHYRGNPSLLCSRDESPFAGCGCNCRPAPDCPTTPCTGCGVETMQTKLALSYWVQCKCEFGHTILVCGSSPTDAINKCMGYAGGEPVGRVFQGIGPCPIVQPTCSIIESQYRVSCEPQPRCQVQCEPKPRCRLFQRLFRRR